MYIYVNMILNKVLSENSCVSLILCDLKKYINKSVLGMLGPNSYYCWIPVRSAYIFQLIHVVSYNNILYL